MPDLHDHLIETFAQLITALDPDAHVMSILLDYATLLIVRSMPFTQQYDEQVVSQIIETFRSYTERYQARKEELDALLDLA